MYNSIDTLFHALFIELHTSAEMNFYKPVELHREQTDAAPQPARGRAFHIEHIKLDLEIDEKQKSLGGAAAITLRPFLSGLTEIELDAAGLAFSSVTAQGNNLSYDTYEDKIVITLDRAYASDETVTLQLHYRARPRKGMFFIEPDEGYPARPLQVWTQGQPNDSAHWFPCYNAPGDKCTSELRVTVNARYTALSNGRLLEIRHDEERGTKTFHWRQDEPHPSYLFSLVVGDYAEIRAEVDGLPLLYFIYPDHKEQAERIFGRTPEMVRHFRERFGYPYPFAKYSQAIVAEFTFGGMENTSATTLTDRVIDWARASTETTSEISYDDLIAHELAHQWWGNLVTCKSWAHNWLNEGFASYAEVMWREHVAGPADAAFYRVQDYNYYLRHDLADYRRPIVSDRYHYAIELFDWHAYQKGSLVLHMLRRELGDEAFFQGLKHYLHKHAHGIVETHDLRIALEEATGRTLESFFHQWLYSAGYPEFEVETHWQRAEKMLHMRVQQKQQTDGDTPLFRVPVEVEIVTEQETRLVKIVVERAEADYFFPLDSKPLKVVFDKGDHLIKRLRFPKAKEELLYQLAHDDEVTGRVRAARALANYHDDQAIEALQRALLQDGFWGVRVAAASALGELTSAPSRAALIAGYKQNRSAQVRRACVWGLGNFPADDDLINLLQGVAARDQSDFVVAMALQALANTRSERVFDLLVSALARDSYRDLIRVSAFIGFTILKEKRALEQVLAFTGYGRSASAREAAIRALGELGKGEDKAYDRLVELLSDRSWRARLMAVKALGKLGDKRAIATLKTVEERESLDQVRSAARAAWHSLSADKKD